MNGKPEYDLWRLPKPLILSIRSLTMASSLLLISYPAHSFSAPLYFPCSSLKWTCPTSHLFAQKPTLNLGLMLCLSGSFFQCRGKERLGVCKRVPRKSPGRMRTSRQRELGFLSTSQGNLVLGSKQRAESSQRQGSKI